MSKYDEKARFLYDCLKDAQEKGAWVDSQLNLIAAALQTAAEEARAEERSECAKLAEEWPEVVVYNVPEGHALTLKEGDRIATAIRERG